MEMIQKLTPAFGALYRAEGAERVDAERLVELTEEHQVLAVRGARFDIDAYTALARDMGEIVVHPYVKSPPDYPGLMHVIKEPSDKINFGGGWHTDMSFLEKPIGLTMLHAIEIPAVGGDTLFASQVHALDLMSDGMRGLLGKINCVHSAEGEYGSRKHSGAKRSAMDIDIGSEFPTYLHPALRRHPRNQRDALYVNGAFVRRFEGMSRGESMPLLKQVVRMGTREEVTLRWRWEPGDLLIWDNRQVQHFAINDYQGHRRAMMRYTLAGESVQAGI